jgi:hypothetical protein
VKIKKLTFQTLFLAALLISGILFLGTHNMVRANPGTIVYVAPSKVTGIMPTGTFTIRVNVSNVINLYGLDVEFTWNPAIIKYVSHNVHIPVENYPDGVLHSPVLTVKDLVNENATIVGPAPGTRYWLSVACLGGPSFNGSGTIFDMTFKVVGVGYSPLAILACTLADQNGNAIGYTLQQGNFGNYPPLSAFINPKIASIVLGQTVDFTSTVSGGWGNYTYQWYKNGTVVPGANTQNWNFTPATFGSYTIYLNVTDSTQVFAFDTVVSIKASVTVAKPAALAASISSPSTTIYVGQTINLTSTVSGGSPPYTRQWLMNGSAIINATLPSYTFSPGYSGSYLFSLNATDSHGSGVLSNVISIMVLPALTSPEIYVSPSRIINLNLGPGSIISVNITVANVTSMAKCSFNVTYDPQVLTWIGLYLVQTQGQYPWVSISGDTSKGQMWMGLTYAAPITSKMAPLIVELFDVKSYGVTPLNLTNTQLLDPTGKPLTHNTFNGLFINIIRDVAVTNVVPARSWVYQTWLDTINVTVANLGNMVSENFTVTALYNSSLIGTAPVVNLAPGAHETVSIVWNTAGVPQGNYTITGEASLVPYEIYFNTTNNVYVDGTVLVLTTIHDVAITQIQSTLSWAYAKTVIPVSVTAANLGDVSESFNVTAYYNGTAIGTLPVTNLTAGKNKVLTFQWDTTGITVEGKYTLSAFASYVQYEYDPTNNYLVDGQVLILTLIRDVAITSVEPYEYNQYTGGCYPQPISPIYHVPMVMVYSNRIVIVNVTAANVGNVTESFNVTAMIDGSIILGTQSISNLAPQKTKLLTFQWKPISETPSSTILHTVSANASIVQNEYNTTNNYMTSTVKIMIKMLGDVNGDGKINILDIVEITAAYGSKPGMSNWNPEADLDNNGVINILDVVTATARYGISY